MENPASPLPDRMNAVGLLNRREIEARFAIPLFQALSSQFGHERAVEILRAVIRNIAHQQGAQLAANSEANDLEHFAPVLDTWKKDNAIQTEVLERSAEKFSFNVFRCRFAEMYHHLGTPELGKLLSCERDAALIEGYNPNIRFTRTQTIMEGADYCDFCFEKTSP